MHVAILLIHIPAFVVKEFMKAEKKHEGSNKTSKNETMKMIVAILLIQFLTNLPDKMKTKGRA